ncbi:hypothetical protein PPERSA_00853 [Pseudocohnilembus persalinus]|uniref:Tyrosine-protein phosphatase domain-containing protein n=1 Tax=Pseudocohnilembus persalinus TaxID=266149 RepID=A0A0V0QEJ5_PSEPJ|nr:hypothetical protein PPERSA_00853 [Pseudocohnilembus persalinus]|eukprot:KRX00626.1 hypothetical protein PPERSA_00853 [Pseudocohnilembus persalinus]
MEYEIVGAIKIKDGLFLGDEYAAQDLEFVVTNKVSRIINCAGKQIPNHWNNIGVQYMTFGWLETDNQIIFDPKDEVLQRTFRFIDDTLNQGDAVLIHSVRGHNRSVCIIAAYLMRKYRWTLYKTLEFLHARRPDLEIRASFFNQLLALENRLSKLGLGAKTYNWKEIAESNLNELENEEILLKNTFLNSKNQEVAEYNDTDDKIVQPKIRWVDEIQDNNKQSIRNPNQSGFQNLQHRLSNNSLNRLLIPCYEKCKFRSQRYSSTTTIKYKSIVKGKNMEYEFEPPKEQDQSLNNSNKPTFKGFRTQILNRNQHSAKPKNSSAKDLTAMRILKNNENQQVQQQQLRQNNNNIENNYLQGNFKDNTNTNNSNLQKQNKPYTFSNGIASKYQSQNKSTDINQNKQSEDQKLQGLLKFANSKDDDEMQRNNNNNGIENSFKSSQRIYTQNFGMRGQPQMNNFLAANNTNKMEMPSINQQNNKPQYGLLYEQDRKNAKKGNNRINRPSTAPSKKQDNSNNKQPLNAFGTRSGFRPQNNNLTQQNKNSNYNDLIITGSQRQRSAQQQNQESFLNKKQRISSPGNYYSNNTLSKQGKWKM